MSRAGQINVNKLVLFRNIVGRDGSGSLGLDWMIILKWILHCKQFMTLSWLMWYSAWLFCWRWLNQRMYADNLNNFERPFMTAFFYCYIVSFALQVLHHVPGVWHACCWSYSPSQESVWFFRLPPDCATVFIISIISQLFVPCWEMSPLWTGEYKILPYSWC